VTTSAPHRLTQPWLIRLSHWVNVIVLPVMAGSGLQILVAFPAFGPRGALYNWYPWNGSAPPSSLRVGSWLAGGRHWHFAFAWILVANGLAYLTYLVVSGEWRQRLFLPRRDSRNAVATLSHYLRLRKQPAAGGLYNGLQRFAYSGALVLAVIQVATGFAIYKPVQLWPLTRLFGGYDPARTIHFLSLLGLAFFTAGHVIMVVLHPRTFPPMVTGREIGTGNEPNAS
jgi:thiosulfate reductase cytochrome b subunit